MAAPFVDAAIAERAMYYRLYARLFRVLAVAPDMAAANKLMEENPGYALLAELSDGSCVLAALSDTGIAA